MEMVVVFIKRIAALKLSDKPNYPDIQPDDLIVNRPDSIGPFYKNHMSASAPHEPFLLYTLPITVVEKRRFIRVWTESAVFITVWLRNQTISGHNVDGCQIQSVCYSKYHCNGLMPYGTLI